MNQVRSMVLEVFYNWRRCLWSQGRKVREKIFLVFQSFSLRLSFSVFNERLEFWHHMLYLHFEQISPVIAGSFLNVFCNERFLSANETSTYSTQVSTACPEQPKSPGTPGSLVKRWWNGRVLRLSSARPWTIASCWWRPWEDSFGWNQNCWP